mmetsp:Transcript_22961/g.74241  ORF Transcript_22961/g.74241 Transcript_22961/m.74241 type:complete len:280 (-) Transcript_22961:53-892(-)
MARLRHHYSAAMRDTSAKNGPPNSNPFHRRLGAPRPVLHARLHGARARGAGRRRAPRQRRLRGPHRGGARAERARAEPARGAGRRAAHPPAVLPAHGLARERLPRRAPLRRVPPALRARSLPALLGEVERVGDPGLLLLAHGRVHRRRRRDAGRDLGRRRAPEARRRALPLFGGRRLRVRVRESVQDPDAALLRRGHGVALAHGARLRGLLVHVLVRCRAAPAGRGRGARHALLLPVPRGRPGPAAVPPRRRRRRGGGAAGRDPGGAPAGAADRAMTRA